jgi:predicted TIM-barrel fold metal-dependent hydrolase
MGDASIRERALAGLPLGVEVIDCHAHVGPSRALDRDTSVEAMLGLMDAIGVTRSAISGFMFGTGVRLETMNDWVAEFVRAHPERFLGLCYLNPRDPEFLEPEMARCFDELGFAGFKLHIDWNGVAYDASAYEPVYRFAAERQVPILAHTWGDSAVRQLASAARANPSVPFLAGHSGAGDVSISIEEARRTPNLFLELAYSAGTPWVVERFVREVGADRIVWGSDSILFAQSHQIAKVAFADLSEWDKAAIFGGNARRIFGLARPGSKGPES